MNRLIPILLLISFAFAEQAHYQTELCAHTFAGDFYLKATDTLKEDVSVSGGNAVIDGFIDGDLAVMGGSVKINGTVDGDVAVFGGEIENSGKITGDAAVAGGSVKNIGTIKGDIAVAGGTVDLDSGSVVEGDIAIVGGSVERSDYAEVQGKITALDIGKLDRVMPRIRPLLKWQRESSPFKQIFWGITGIASILVMYLLNLLCLVIFPAAMEKIGSKIRKNIWIAIAIGIGIEILFVPLIILFAISIIGIPVIPAFVLAIFIAIIFGISAFSLVLGERICLGLKWQVTNKIALFTIGWVALMVILMIGAILKQSGFLGVLVWILGIVILYAGATIGIGGVGYALAKRKK
ncbi:MAG: hypothetical protein ACPL28_04240 [bacterium]